MTDKEKELVKQYRSENKSYKEIADILGTTKNTIKGFCNKYGFNGIKGGAWSLDGREQAFKERFEKQQPGFNYVSGYIGRVEPIKCQCKVCGHIQERNAQCARVGLDGVLITCDNCVEIEKRKAEEYRVALAEEKKVVKHTKRLNKNRKRKEKEAKLNKVCKMCGAHYKATMVNGVYCQQCIDNIKKDKEEARKQWEGMSAECVECGALFTKTRASNTCCSLECKRKRSNRMKEINRRHKLRENGKINWDITLPKLYKRDHGVCHICKGKVDMRADSNSDNYGSIDHVFPVSKGGTHTWDNINLAHRGCNSNKRDKLIYEEQRGQMTFAL